MEWLLLLYLLSRAHEATRPGRETVVKARDGSSHRLRASSDGTAWVATSTDTSVRFREGESLTILGRPYRWHNAGPLLRERGSAFNLGAFLP